MGKIVGSCGSICAVECTMGGPFPRGISPSPGVQNRSSARPRAPQLLLCLPQARGAKGAPEIALPSVYFVNMLLKKCELWCELSKTANFEMGPTRPSRASQGASAKPDGARIHQEPRRGHPPKQACLGSRNGHTSGNHPSSGKRANLTTPRGIVPLGEPNTGMCSPCQGTKWGVHGRGAQVTPHHSEQGCLVGA